MVVVDAPRKLTFSRSRLGFPRQFRDGSPGNLRRWTSPAGARLFLAEAITRTTEPSDGAHMASTCQGPLALAGLVTVAAVIVAAIAAPMLAPFNPTEQFFEGLTLDGDALRDALDPTQRGR